MECHKFQKYKDPNIEIRRRRGVVRETKDFWSHVLKEVDGESLIVN